MSLQISNPEKEIPGDPQLAAFLCQLMAYENSGTTQHSIPMATSVLHMQSRLSSYSKDWKVFNDHLQRLSNQELPEKDFVQLARFLADLNEAYSDINSRAPFEKAATDFWKQAHKRTKRGQDLWLEASLSLAESAIFHNDKNEARKIIGVVKVLYPEWGSEARKARADRLEKLLTSSEVTSP
jgi:hypothetical protein